MSQTTKSVSSSRIKFFRLITFLEGISLIVLVFVGMPMKYLMDDPSVVKLLGPIHGALFVVFIYMAWQVGTDLKWKWSEMIWKILLASFVPFGTFYLDYKVLRHL